MIRPEVTVLMPVRDGAAHLHDSVRSILAQRHADFEFLICDDGSTDATPRLLAAYAAQDPRCRILHLPQAGIVAALNAGLREARADWVARMDADDIADPARLGAQIAAARAWPEAAAIGSAWRVVGPDRRFRRLIVPPTEPAAIADALMRHNCLAHPTMLLRRAAVLAAGGYRTAFRGAEDYDLWLRLAERHPLRALPDPLLDYREHAGQTAWVALEQRILTELGARVSAAARRAGRGDPSADVETIDRAFLHVCGVTEAEIAGFTIERALGAATDALAAGQVRAARAALRLLWAQPKLRLRTRAHAVVLFATTLTVALRR